MRAHLQPGRTDVDIGFLIIVEISARERPKSRADLSNTGMCGSIARSSVSHSGISADP